MPSVAPAPLNLSESEEDKAAIRAQGDTLSRKLVAPRPARNGNHNLNIRHFPAALLWRLRAEATRERITLRELVIRRLSQPAEEVRP